MIDPRRLHLLAEVAATGTVTAAAEATGYTPSAVSQQLRRLREQVGVDLLDRRGRNVVLTPAGRALVDAAPDVLGAIERAEAAARAAAGHVAGQVRLGALASTLVDLVPRALTSLAAERPELDPRVVHLGDELLGELRERRIDVAVEHQWSNVAALDLDGLVEVTVLTEPIYVVAPSGLDLTDQDLVAAQPWSDHPCDQCGPAARALIRSFGGDVDRRPFVTDDLSVMIQLAALGSALSVVPGLASLHLPDGVDVWEVPNVHRRIAAFVRSTGRDDPSLVAVTEHLRSAGDTLAALIRGLEPVGVLTPVAGGGPSRRARSGG